MYHYSGSYSIDGINKGKSVIKSANIQEKFVLPTSHTYRDHTNKNISHEIFMVKTVMTQAQGERVYRPLHGEAGEAKQPYYVITAIPTDSHRSGWVL